MEFARLPVIIFRCSKKIKAAIVDILFPINCIYCDSERQWICEPCLTKIKIIVEHHCPVCEKSITPNGRVCFSCRKKSPLSGMLTATNYTDISKAIHFYKYRFIADLSEPLSKLLIKTIAASNLPIPDLIIPIPLHPKRLRWRGFNQSSLLAKKISCGLLPNFPIEISEDLLVRTRFTKPQMNIKDSSARKRNIKDAFLVKNGRDIKNKTVLLIDDVATTGCTIFECAKVLKSAGAKNIYACVIARQS